METFFVAFELEVGTPADYHTVYEFVHTVGGYHYRRDDAGRWGHLPAGTVVVPLPAAIPELARIAFELDLAHLSLHAASILVLNGDHSLQLCHVTAMDVPRYVLAAEVNRQVDIHKPTQSS